jgi:hypothetical protein
MRHRESEEDATVEPNRLAKAELPQVADRSPETVAAAEDKKRIPSLPYGAAKKVSGERPPEASGPDSR